VERRHAGQGPRGYPLLRDGRPQRAAQRGAKPGKQLASAPPPSVNAIIGTMFAANTTPRLAGVPPAPSTAKAMATEDIAVPSSDAE